jgi:hypothetical protein
MGGFSIAAPVACMVRLRAGFPLVHVTRALAFAAKA